MGPDSVVASVFATINFDKKNSIEQLVTPVNPVTQKGIEISLQEIQRSFSSEGAAGSGGIVGSGTEEIFNYPSAQESGGSTNSEEFEQIVNYEVNRITNEIVRSPYAIVDLTINVGIEPPDPSNPESLTQEMRDSVKQLLVNIVGAALANSGNQYTQQQLEQKVLVFAQPFLGKTAGSAPTESTTGNIWWIYALAGVAAAALLAVGSYTLAKRRMQRLEEETELAATAPVVEDQLELENVSQENQMHKQLDNLAKKRPEEFVNLLRTWLAEE
jgi:flagellar M-ring protein FliF